MRFIKNRPIATFIYAAVIIFLCMGAISNPPWNSMYRSVTVADGTADELTLTDQSGLGKTQIAILPYGGDNGGAVDNTAFTTSGTFDLEICPTATTPTSLCKNKIVVDLTSSAAVGSAGAVYEQGVYDFMGVRATSVSIAGTNSPAFRIYIKKVGR